MRFLISMQCVILILGSAVTTSAQPVTEFFQPLDPPRGFAVMVHRGAMNQAPENTASALEHVIRDTFTWAEVDIRLTQDGRHILFHDDAVDEKTNGKGKVSELTLEEIQSLDAGRWFAPRFAGEKILKLEECLKLCKERLNLYLDCKDIDSDLLVKQILDSGMENQVLVYLGEIPVLQKIREESKGRVKTMTKWRPEMGSPSDWLRGFKPEAVEIDADELTLEAVKEFHSQGVLVQVKVLGEWDAPEWWERGFEAGVDFFQTDLPEEVVAHGLLRSNSGRETEFSLHRGALRYAPENTFPAFDKGVALGADYIEIDIRTTSDGRLVLLHDGNLDRTTTGKGPASEKSFEVVRGLDAGSWFGKPFTGIQVPTFEEVLEKYRGKIGFYCDAKDIPAKDLANLLEKYDVLRDSVVYQGVDYLAELQSLNPNIRAMPPLSDKEEIDSILERVSAFAFDTRWESLSPELIAAAHERGVRIFSDAMGHDTPEEHRQAMEWGIDLIQTDHPMAFFRALELTQAKAVESGMEK